MLPSFRDLKQEFRPMISLAAPVVVAEIGWVAMGLVDTLDGRPARTRSDRRGRHRQLRLHRHRDLRDGRAARTRHARIAGLRRRASRRLPPVAGARCRAEPVRRGAGDAPAVLPDQPARPMGARSDRPSPDASLPRRRRVECPAAPVLRDLSPLPAGHGHRPAGHDRARLGEPRQRVRQLGAHLRQAWCAGDGRSRRRVGHRPLARDDGRVPVRRDRPA